MEVAVAESGGGRRRRRRRPATSRRSRCGCRPPTSPRARASPRCASPATPSTRASRPRPDPNLYDIVGGPAAHMEGFKYSDAMQEAARGRHQLDLRRTSTTSSPTRRATCPGRRWASPACKKPDERADVIAYLGRCRRTRCRCRRRKRQPRPGGYGRAGRRYGRAAGRRRLRTTPAPAATAPPPAPPADDAGARRHDAPGRRDAGSGRHDTPPADTTAPARLRRLGRPNRRRSGGTRPLFSLNFRHNRPERGSFARTSTLVRRAIRLAVR